MIDVTNIDTLLVLVGKVDDMASAIGFANGLVSHWRQSPSYTKTEILGIWLRRELEVGLPLFASFDDSLDREMSLGRRAECMGIRESFSLSRISSVCRLEGNLSSKVTAKERRHMVLDTFVKTAPAKSAATDTGVFFPVFDHGEEHESIEATSKELRERFPTLIGVLRFVDDGAMREVR